ncbi:MAG: hypothetical protein M1275_01960 [Patescibacteria group bacterium]|nr:hypothetical protein [Patescibacteria group bacterium]
MENNTNRDFLEIPQKPRNGFFVPKSFSGKLALGFGIALAASISLSLVFAFFINGDAAVIEKNPTLTFLAYALSFIFSLSAPLSFFIGIYTIIKQQEWSIWKPLAILYGLTLIIFLLGEFIFPH